MKEIISHNSENEAFNETMLLYILYLFLYVE